jgi:hypothetical protein
LHFERQQPQQFAHARRIAALFAICAPHR